MRVMPAGETCGAYLEDVDLDVLTPAQFEQILDAWQRYRVIGVRGQTLTAEAFHRFACRLGRPQPHVLDQYHHPDNADILILSNVIEANGRPRGLADGGSYWHSDYSYKTLPAKATLLYSLECPGDGGDTLFIDMARAYAGLPGALKERLRGLYAMHDYEYRHRQQITAHGVRRPLTDEQKALTPQVRHPVVRRHPDTGEPALFINPGFTVCFEGMDEAQSSALRDELFAHVLRPEHVFAYKWRRGDVVLWDNRALIHSATQGYRENRTLWRITVLAEAPIPYAEA
jgi:taurine dioxygenase